MIVENRKNQEEKITVKEKIEERRQNVYTLDLKGYSNEEIAEKQKVSPSTVEKDLQFVRNNWQERLMQLDMKGYSQARLDALEHKTMVIHELWQLSEKEENPKVKLNILMSISQIASDLKELMQNKPDLLGVPGVV